MINESFGLPCVQPHVTVFSHNKSDLRLNLAPKLLNLVFQNLCAARENSKEEKCSETLNICRLYFKHKTNFEIKSILAK